MSGLSEVSRLFAQRAGDLEKAREIFTAETRNYVSSILGGIQRTRSEPWTSGRIRVDLPREIETESKTGYLTSQYALARASLCFKKATRFQAIADLLFGIEYDSREETFVWRVSLVPSSRYQRLDDVIWRDLRNTPAADLPAAHHDERANTIRFVQRALTSDLAPEAPFNDVKVILESLLANDAGLAEAVGVDGVMDVV